MNTSGVTETKWGEAIRLIGRDVKTQIELNELKDSSINHLVYPPTSTSPPLLPLFHSSVSQRTAFSTASHLVRLSQIIKIILGN